MSPRLNNGVYQPPLVKIHFSGTVFNHYPVTAVVKDIQIPTGVTYGSAVVSYPSHYASDASPEMGESVRIAMQGRTIFRGVVGHVPFEVDPDTDQVDLILFDDRWPMSAAVVGMIGVGTQPAGSPGDSGFKDVGFELVFNADGKPNKDPSSLEFSRGSTAVYWSLGNILEFLFSYYVASGVATLDTDILSSSYNYEPSDMNLVGMTALDAVDTVVSAAGESWGLTYGTTASAFTCVVPGAGTIRKVQLAKPKGGTAAYQADEYYPDAARGGKSIKDNHDAFQAVSDRIVKETVLTSTGATPMLKRETTFKDKKFAARFKVDVSKYEDNNLGLNLSTGARPKPWLKHLVTRMKADDSGYVTKAQIDSTPALKHYEPVKKPPVWLALDGVEANARLVTGNYKIDCKEGTVDFQGIIKQASTSGTKPEKVSVSDWSSVGIWMTVATVLETPEHKETASGSQYLSTHMYEVILKPDLIPERRQDSWLPDLTDSDNNAITKLATSAEEKYIDVGTKLQNAIDAAIAATSTVEAPLDLSFPFMPVINVGDRLSVKGRDIGATGDEVVIELVFKLYESYYVNVKASNVVAGVKPQKFVREE